MYRELYEQLLKWKNGTHRKPLIINGARQVGKTYLLKEFGKTEYEKVSYVSLDRNEKAREVFERGGQTDRLFTALSAITGVDITAGDTLLILDEIQDCPRAL
jgi:predicted AAA+ superfamily ATPase